MSKVVHIVNSRFDNKHMRSCLASRRSVSGWGHVTHGARALQPNGFRFRFIPRKVPGLSQSTWVQRWSRDHGCLQGAHMDGRKTSIVQGAKGLYWPPGPCSFSSGDACANSSFIFHLASSKALIFNSPSLTLTLTFVLVPRFPF